MLTDTKCLFYIFACTVPDWGGKERLMVVMMKLNKEIRTNNVISNQIMSKLCKKEVTADKQEASVALMRCSLGAFHPVVLVDALHISSHHKIKILRERLRHTKQQYNQLLN